MTQSPGTAIYVEGLTVAFGRFVAIRDLDFLAAFGEVHAVIGPNGAGKTTLLDVLTGKARPQRGRMLLDGRIDLATLGEAGIVRAGVGRKFQRPSVFDALTVAENLDLAARGAVARIPAMLETIGLAARAAAPAGTLSHGQKQWLEIGMVLVQEPRVVLLDEPVAGMSDEETAATADLVRSLRAPDRAVILVEHDMEFVERVADRVTVLHEGQTLFEGSMAAARSDPRVIETYLGR
jgi:urea transport system ATP-binding protein